MADVILFGGTYEGRELTDYLAAIRADSLVCVVSDYGRSLLRENSLIRVRTGALPKNKMIKLFSSEKPKVVIDATHPYAAHISSTLADVCGSMGIELISVRRKKSETDSCRIFSDIDEMIDALNDEDAGSSIVFSTMGAKESTALSRIKNFKERIYTRILPLEKSLHDAISAGIPPKHIICMQGPFSEAINEVMFRESGAEILLTKESGHAGGFDEKVSAARKLGMDIWLLKRPESDPGVTIKEAEQAIQEIVR